MEASALGHLQQDIDIYSNSWGPTDNGVLVDGPGPLTRAVMENGIKTVSEIIDTFDVCSCLIVLKVKLRWLITCICTVVPWLF